MLFSAILVAANEALLEIARLVGAHEEERALTTDWIKRGRRGLAASWNPDLGLCLDHDLRTGKSLRVRTVAGFVPPDSGKAESRTGRRPHRHARLIRAPRISLATLARAAEH